MSATPQSICLSYAAQDAGAARRIYDALCAAGLDVWFDQSAQREAAARGASIRRQVKECAPFVSVIAANTQAHVSAPDEPGLKFLDVPAQPVIQRKHP